MGTIVEADAPNLRRRLVRNQRDDFCEWNGGKLVDAGQSGSGALLDNGQQVVRDFRAEARVDLCHGNYSARIQHTGMNFISVQEANKFHLVFFEATVSAMSTASLNKPYAVCRTPPLMTSVPTVPIRSVWISKRFEVPSIDASKSLSFTTSARTRVRTPDEPIRARLTNDTVLPTFFSSNMRSGVRRLMPRRSTSCVLTHAFIRTLASRAVFAAASHPSIS